MSKRTYNRILTILNQAGVSYAADGEEINVMVGNEVYDILTPDDARDVARYIA